MQGTLQGPTNVRVAKSGEIYEQVVVFLDHLPPRRRNRFKQPVKQIGMHGYRSVPGGAREKQHVLDAPFHSLDELKGPATLALSGDRAHHVANLITDQRLSQAIEDGKQNVLVLNLDDGAIVEQMFAAIR